MVNIGMKNVILPLIQVAGNQYFGQLLLFSKDSLDIFHRSVYPDFRVQNHLVSKEWLY